MPSNFDTSPSHFGEAGKPGKPLDGPATKRRFALNETGPLEIYALCPGHHPFDVLFDVEWVLCMLKPRRHHKLPIVPTGLELGGVSVEQRETVIASLVLPGDIGMNEMYHTRLLLLSNEIYLREPLFDPMRSRTCPRKAHDVFACTELLNAPEARGSVDFPCVRSG
jgi:hypothetical protein